MEVVVPGFREPHLTGPSSREAAVAVEHCVHGVVEFVFFFQAEDGIRDHCVTGVQTCALPICMPRGSVSDSATRSAPQRTVWLAAVSMEGFSRYWAAFVKLALMLSCMA